MTFCDARARVGPIFAPVFDAIQCSLYDFPRMMRHERLSHPDTRCSELINLNFLSYLRCLTVTLTVSHADSASDSREAFGVATVATEASVHAAGTFVGNPVDNDP